MTAHFVPAIDRLVISGPREAGDHVGVFRAGPGRWAGGRRGWGPPVLVARLCMMTL